MCLGKGKGEGEAKSAPFSPEATTRVSFIPLETRTMFGVSAPRPEAPAFFCPTEPPLELAPRHGVAQTRSSVRRCLLYGSRDGCTVASGRKSLSDESASSMNA